MQMVVQMVRMQSNAHEVDEFKRFWSAVPGVDQVRIKEDETNVLQPEAVANWRRIKSLPLFVAWSGLCEARRPRISVLPELHAGRRADRPAAGAELWRRSNNSDEMRRLRRLHAEGRAGEIDMCARCCVAIPHPLLVAGSLMMHGKWVRRAVPVIERMVYGAQGCRSDCWRRNERRWYESTVNNR